MTLKYRNRPVGKFRSKLERICYTELVAEGIDFQYEPTKYLLLEGFEFDGGLERVGKRFKEPGRVRPIYYIPDFVGNDWIIETKGVRTPAFNLKWKLFKQYLKERDLRFTLYLPSNKTEIKETIEHIKQNTT